MTGHATDHAQWFATLTGEELAELPLSILTKRAWNAATRAVNEAIADQLALAGVADTNENTKENH